MAIPLGPALTPVEQEVIARYTAGGSLRSIAAAMGLSPWTVRQYLAKGNVRAAIAERMSDLEFRIMDFKMRAVEGAEQGLEKLMNLGQHAGTEELQRLASLDVVKISGLMPRKRVLVQQDTKHGIDEDAKDFIASTFREAMSIMPPNGEGAKP